MKKKNIRCNDLLYAKAYLFKKYKKAFQFKEKTSYPCHSHIALFLSLSLFIFFVIHALFSFLTSLFLFL